MTTKIPVILDTDIGTDIDDTWALGFLLKCPELDLRLVTTASGDPEYRAKIAAKFMAQAGFDVPVGIGMPSSDEIRSQAEWVADYDLGAYSGTVHRDGIGAMIDLISQSPGKIKVICIGPMTNLAEALRRSPKIAEKAELICMLGSIYKGAWGSEGKIAEYNVVQDIKAAQDVFAGGWPIAMTPLDSSGLVKLEGDLYQQVHRADNCIVRMIMENYKIWDRLYKFHKFERESSILYDTVAVHMAYSFDFLEMQPMGIRISDDGIMHQDAKAKKIDCAINWTDKAAFHRLLADRLTN